MQDTLPSVFGELVNQVTNVRRKSANEFSSSCPYCMAGDDRFVLFVVGKGGFPFAFCRHDPSGHRWYPSKDHKLTQGEIDEFRRNQIEVEKARIEASQRVLQILQNDRMWESFFDQNSEWSRKTFAEWGISETWIKYLQLGFMPQYILHRIDEPDYFTPAFTIPIWNVGGVVQNIKLRLANPPSPGSRYRNYYSTGQSFLFVPLYDLPLKGAGVIVEGERKAIVVEQTINNPKYRVVGIQSKTPAPELFSQLKDLDPIYICLDPDAAVKEGKNQESAVEYVTRLVGKDRARIVNLPMKPDDGIIQHGMDIMKFIQMGKSPL